MIAMHAKKCLYTSHTGKTWRLIQDIFYKSETSSGFPKFDSSDTWQIGHKSREGFFLGQELLLDFAARINLTLNADKLIILSCI